MRWLAVLPLLLAMPSFAPSALAQKGFPATTVIVGGHPMASDRDLLDNLALSADHHVLLDLLDTAGMLERLRGRGPFTLFAPTDAAFAALPRGELDRLRQPESRTALRELLALHIVPSNYSSKRLTLALRSNKGGGELETLDGVKLVLSTNGPSNMTLRDPKGGIADIVLYDAKQANGVLFVIDRVLHPAS
jgi:uncharacterized surface protein with fasciclin (FAS1) repeats